MGPQGLDLETLLPYTAIKCNVKFSSFSLAESDSVDCITLDGSTTHNPAGFRRRVHFALWFHASQNESGLTQLKDTASCSTLNKWGHYFFSRIICFYPVLIILKEMERLPEAGVWKNIDYMINCNPGFDYSISIHTFPRSIQLNLCLYPVTLKIFPLNYTSISPLMVQMVGLSQWHHAAILVHYQSC